MKQNLISYNIKTRTIKLTTIALFCSLAVVLSIVDSMIPAMSFLPPGAKLGLSNIVTMYTAGSIGIGTSLIIAVVKSLFVGVTRGSMAFFMSFFAGIASTLVSGFFIRIKKKVFGLVGIGIIGALTHNITQLIVVILITKTFSLIYYLPVLIIFAIVTGALTGVTLKIVVPALEKIKMD